MCAPHEKLLQSWHKILGQNIMMGSESERAGDCMNFFFEKNLIHAVATTTTTYSVQSSCVIILIFVIEQCWPVCKVNLVYSVPTLTSDENVIFPKGYSI